jgi:arsenite methyltransferase
MHNKTALRGAIRTNYAKVARGSSAGCCGGGCCGTDTQGSPAEIARALGYEQSDVSGVPAGANMGLGCGNPLSMASLQKGETVLDLGCGGGFDCFLASQRVGDSGRVIGVDMTPEMIELARDNAEKGGYANVEFRLGEIETLPVADGCVDVILSNCVINLATDKRRVYREAYRALKPGGRLSISDVLAIRPLPEAVRDDLSMISGCIGGAELAENIREMLGDAGFADIVLKPLEHSRAIIGGWNFKGNPEDYVASYEIRARKPSKTSSV